MGASLDCPTAILLDEIGLLPGADLRGIDCRHSAIARAREGVFEEPEVEGMDLDLLRRYLFVEGKGFRTCEKIRRSISWEVGDLLEAPLGRDWDLVLCRNIMIYLEPDRAADGWGRLAAALRPGGHLVAGKAERPPAGLGLSRVGSCISMRGGRGGDGSKPGLAEAVRPEEGK
jgi:chemotaxis protein methyltransferase CheR